MIPENLHYTSTHEWARVEDGIATVGITDFAIKLLTDLVFLDLPSPGTRVEKGKPLGEVESVKAVSELNAPVSGEVMEVHADLAENLEILSRDPYGKGWLVKVKLSNPAEVSSLMTAAAYGEQLEKEGH